MSNAKLEQNCQRILLEMDQYLDNSLAADERGKVLAHLNECSACSQELEARTNLRSRLRSSVKSIQTPPFLESRIRANLRETHRSFHWKSAAVSVAAALLVCIGATIAYQLGHLRLTVASRESYIASVSTHVASIMRVGLGDHVHCAVFGKFPKSPNLEKFAAEMGPEYAGLIPVVRQNVPEELSLVAAHRCRYHGRRFVHLALKSDSRLLSVVIALKGDGEAFTTEELVPVLTEAGIPIYRSGVQRFQIAAFESGAHLVYVISDLPQQQNLQLIRAMAPAVKAFLQKLES
jgi:anti-sigma factor (TIGR02949 family)